VKNRTNSLGVISGNDLNLASSSSVNTRVATPNLQTTQTSSQAARPGRGDRVLTGDHAPSRLAFPLVRDIRWFCGGYYGDPTPVELDKGPAPPWRSVWFAGSATVVIRTTKPS